MLRDFISLGFPEKQNQQEKEREISFKELAHVIAGADKSTVHRPASSLETQAKVDAVALKQNPSDSGRLVLGS